MIDWNICLNFKGIFDAIDRLGGMIARIVLAPLEETIGVYFSQNLKRAITIKNQDSVCFFYIYWYDDMEFRERWPKLLH